MVEMVTSLHGFEDVLRPYAESNHHKLFGAPPFAVAGSCSTARE